MAFIFPGSPDTSDGGDAGVLSPGILKICPSVSSPPPSDAAVHDGRVTRSFAEGGELPDGAGCFVGGALDGDEVALGPLVGLAPGQCRGNGVGGGGTAQHIGGASEGGADGTAGDAHGLRGSIVGGG